MSPPAMPDGSGGYPPDHSNSGAPQSGPPGGWQPNGQPPPQTPPPQAYPQQQAPGYPGPPSPQQPGYPYTDPGQYGGAPAPQQQSGYPYMGQGQQPGYPTSGGPQQPGYPYPYADPAQQGIPGQPPSKKGKVGWLIGIIAIVLVLIGTGGTLYATGVFGGGGAGGGTADTKSEDTDDRYVSPEMPCQTLELDLSGFEERAPAEGELEETDYGEESTSSADDVWQCHVEFYDEESYVSGELSIVTQFHATAEGAERTFESPAGLATDPEDDEEQKGEWDQGKRALDDKETSQQQDLAVQDGNLWIWVYFEQRVAFDEELDFSAEDFTEPLHDMAIQIMDGTRA